MYKVGDVIQFKNSTVRKKITKVRATGYSFVDLETGEEVDSEMYVDRFLEDGWKLA